MKQIVITGANAGLGFASSLRLAEAGHHIIMLCRSEERGKQAVKQVQQVGSAELVVCDLEDKTQIERVQACFVGKKIDVLMHNAGVFLNEYKESPQGLELTLAINHFAVVQLTYVLWQYLDPQARIIVISSDAHKAARLDFSRWLTKRYFSGFSQYATSKLCNILFVQELARRVGGQGITVNAVHPGAVNTKLGDGMDSWMSPLFTLAKKFMASPERGADTQVWMTEADLFETQTGGYFAKRRLKKPSAQGQDVALGMELWEHSVSILGIESSWLAVSS